MIDNIMYMVKFCEVIGDYGQEEWTETFDSHEKANERKEYFYNHGKYGNEWYVISGKIEEISNVKSMA